MTVLLNRQPWFRGNVHTVCHGVSKRAVKVRNKVLSRSLNLGCLQVTNGSLQALFITEASVAPSVNLDAVSTQVEVFKTISLSLLSRKTA